MGVDAIDIEGKIRLKGLLNEELKEAHRKAPFMVGQLQELRS
jgi:hypothetical protein